MISQYINGIFRDVFFAFDVVLVFVCIQIAFLFFINKSKNKGTFKTDLGWGLVFICFGILSLMNIYRVYYLSEELWIQNMKINSLVGIIPGLIVVGIMENFYQQYRSTKFFFTIQASAIGVITFFTGELLTSVLADISLFFLGIFIIFFFKDLIKNSAGVVRRNIILFAIAFFILMFGSLITNPRVIANQLRIGVDVFVTGLIGRFVQMISLFVMALILFKTPIFFELDWRSKLVQIYVIHKVSSQSIFHNKFQANPQEEKKELSEVLVAGGMTGISVILKEISQSKQELKRIDHGDYKIMLDHGTYIFIALIVTEEMRIYMDKITRVRKEIETFFEEILKSWNGDLEYFKPIAKIVSKEFQ